MRGLAARRHLLLAMLGAGCAFAGWWMLSAARAADATQAPDVPAAVAQDVSSPAASDLSAAIQALQGRCTLAMIRGTCSVMKPDGQAPAATRVFVAGAGEVDAQVYAELRRQGDEMCAAARRHCEQDWQGKPCRIARALYPETGP